MCCVLCTLIRGSLCFWYLLWPSILFALLLLFWEHKRIPIKWKKGKSERGSFWVLLQRSLPALLHTTGKLTHIVDDDCLRRCISIRWRCSFGPWLLSCCNIHNLSRATDQLSWNGKSITFCVVFSVEAHPAAFKGHETKAERSSTDHFSSKARPASFPTFVLFLIIEGRINGSQGSASTFTSYKEKKHRKYMVVGSLQKHDEWVSHCHEHAGQSFFKGSKSWLITGLWKTLA